MHRVLELNNSEPWDEEQFKVCNHSVRRRKQHKFEQLEELTSGGVILLEFICPFCQLVLE